VRGKAFNWAMPGGIFVCAFALSAACGSQGPGDVAQADCGDDGASSAKTTAATGAGGSTAGPSTVASSGSGAMVPQYDPPTAEEIASRLHGCHKLPFDVLATFLSRRGVAMVGLPTTPFFTSPQQANTYDGKNTPVTSFGVPTTLGKLLGGSNATCQIGGCASNETCFCNQDDKQAGNPANKQPTECVGGPGGYCVSKPATSMLLYLSGKEALGVPRLDSRMGEKDEHTTASAVRLMDVFVQAAPQIIANIGNPVKAPACTRNGVNKPMFDPSDGSCVEQSVTCLLGVPATDDHLLLCNLLVQKANPVDPADVDEKRLLAVAVLLSGTHACE
jgi:hypothetical protein